MRDFVLAGGREIPPLLFVTSESALGQIESNGLNLEQHLPDPHRLVVLTTNPANARLAADELWGKVPHDAEQSAYRGVVLIGGYDVVPSRVVAAGGIDQPKASYDRDRLYVWNDDVYGDLDGDDMPELPVSRIPLLSADLERALRATEVAAAAVPRDDWRKIRTGEFLFPDFIHSQVPGSGAALVSPPLNPATTADMNAGRLYVVLHGDSFQHAAFNSAGAAVFKQGDIPDADGIVVFAACCWGALTANTTATLFGLGITPSQPLATIQANQSIALTFIAKGAKAFVGFTALHWVPRNPPYEYFGAPLHRMFWKNVNQRNLPPAQALLEAKAEYINFIATPHINPKVESGTFTQDEAHALELKTYWSATCLGLGW